MSSVRNVKAGRPAGARKFDPGVAEAFGDAVRAARLELGLAQEALAAAAEVERSHVGKIERGEHAPQLSVIFALATALHRNPSDLLLDAERLLRRKIRTGG